MPPRKILNGRYELGAAPLGHGGMGEVWPGRDTKLDREVAVKLIRFPDDVPDDELVRRFVRESRITARLQHPGVPAVFDVGTDDDRRPFMVMQYVHGITVADLVAEQGPLPIGWAAAIAAQTCAVLVAAHRESLVHRDLKPGNLILGPDGTVHVLDFGLAVALGRGDSLITRTGQTLGTPAYMAPELVSAGTAVPQTDLYALGCTLHELLAGARPFRGATAYAVMTQQVDARPPALRTQRPEVPAELEQLVLDLLAKAPGERPAAGEAYARLAPFARDLGELAGALATSGKPSPTRMYAAVVGRVLDDPEPTTSRSVPADPGFSRGDLATVRARAASLVRGSQYEQATTVLAAAVPAATEVLGPADSDVLSLRFELANVRFDGGDYRGAAPAYRDLAADVAAHRGPDDDLALRCRQQAATCDALSGRVDDALRQLESLLADEQRSYGSDDGRVLELRKQIGLLLLGNGQRDAADRVLRALLTDAERIHGTSHDVPRAVRSVLVDLDRDQ